VKKALSIFEKCRRAMSNPSSPTMFVKWQNGTIFDEPIDLPPNHVMNQFIYNFTDNAARELLLQVVVDDVTSQQSVDGVFLDGIELGQNIWDVTLQQQQQQQQQRKRQTQQHPHLTPQQIASIVSNQHQTLQLVSARLLATQKLLWQWWQTGVVLPTRHLSSGQCIDRLQAATTLSQIVPTALPGLYGDHCVGPFRNCPDLHLQLIVSIELCVCTTFCVHHYYCLFFCRCF
jgi:hypothetical protein